MERAFFSLEAARRQLAAPLTALRHELQQLMDTYCRVVRNEEGLEYALGRAIAIRDSLSRVFEDSKNYFEMLNLATTAVEVLKAALARRESAGAHYREN